VKILGDGGRDQPNLATQTAVRWKPGISSRRKTKPAMIQLVVSTHLKHISQIGSFPQVGVK